MNKMVYPIFKSRGKLILLVKLKVNYFTFVFKMSFMFS